MSGPKQIAVAEITPIVLVVDDDVSVRESLQALITAAGYRVEVFASAEAFLAYPWQQLAGCLVLDVSLPDLSGLELQRRLASHDALPIIFITGHGDIPMTVRAMRAGAVEFLTKPYGPEIILGAIANAVERSRATLHQRATLHALRDRHGSLTPRERQVMALVVRGLMNKQVGRRSRDQRDHGQGTQRSDDGEDGCAVIARTCEHGGPFGAFQRGERIWKDLQPTRPLIGINDTPGPGSRITETCLGGRNQLREARVLIGSYDCLVPARSRTPSVHTRDDALHRAFDV